MICVVMTQNFFEEKSTKVICLITSLFIVLFWMAEVVFGNENKSSGFSFALSILISVGLVFIIWPASVEVGRLFYKESHLSVYFFAPIIIFSINLLFVLFVKFLIFLYFKSESRDVGGVIDQF